MYSRIMPMALVLASLVGEPTQAQLMFGPTWESNITLTQGDLDLIHRAVDTEVHGNVLMAAPGVRRDKAALSSGCKPHPAIRSSRKQPEQAWRRRNV